jgi:lysophospholipase
LHGLSEFIEKYTEVIDELRARGFVVATFDWRSQGGSQRALTDPFKIHVEDFAQYDADLAAFMDQVVSPLDHGPIIALAHSMGGHVLLRALKAKPVLVQAAVLSAPMIGMQTDGYPSVVARGICKLQTLLGHRTDWVWGADKLDPLTMEFAAQRVTRDPHRFARTQALLRAAPDLRTKGPSWGWLDASFRSIARMRQPGFGSGLTTPLLTFGALSDRVVVSADCQGLMQRLSGARYVPLRDAEHEILMERDAIRAQFWAAFDAFVAEQLSGRQ